MNALDELRRNPRLRVGLAGVVALLAASSLLDWHARQQAREEALGRTWGQAAQLASRAGMQLWPQRAEAARAQLDTARGSWWSEPSVGLAQAAFQDFLRQQLATVNAQNVAVRIAEAEGLARTRVYGRAEPAAPALLRVTAQLEFTSPDPAATPALLAALAAHPRKVVVESLTVRPMRVEMRVSAWCVQP